MVRNGIDNLKLADGSLRGRRLGVISTPAAVNAVLEESIDVLRGQYDVKLLFSPEHGLRGAVQAGEAVKDCVDEKTGLPVCSLYGGENCCAPERLDGLDAIVYDIQDVGCRYYTFISTMKNMMQLCAQTGKTFVVLDRVNPIGDAVEGNLLDSQFSSFVGIDSIPQRYGLTAGELARYFNERIGCDLHVVPVSGWKREMYFRETGLNWVNPSPNIPTAETAVLYPGTCLIEGTNLSEGRGTTKPFELIGAPWLDGEKLAAHLNGKGLPGVHFRPTYFQPGFSKHSNVLCRGVQIHITDSRRVLPLLTGLELLCAAVDMSGDHFAWIRPEKEKGEFFIDLLAGTDRLRKEMDVASYYNDCLRDAETFRQKSKNYLLYE